PGHHLVALLLGEIAMQGFDVVAFSYEILGDLLRISLGAREDDSVNTRIEVDDSLQCFVPVMMLCDTKLMIDVHVARIHLPDCHLERLFHVLPAHLPDGGRHGRTEEPRALAFW